MTAVDLVWAVVKYSGVLVTAAAAAGGGAWLFLKRYGEKLMDARFDKELASFKSELDHDLQAEIERHKSDLQKEFHRSSKLYEREFKTLPQAWHLLTMAYSDALGLTAIFQQYADVGSMSFDQLTEFLAGAGLPKWQSMEILNGSDKTKLYVEYAGIKQIFSAKKSCGELNNFLLDKGIFIQQDILALMKQAKAEIWDAILEREIDKQNPMPGPDRFKRGSEMRDNAHKLMDAIEVKVRERIWLYEGAG